MAYAVHPDRQLVACRVVGGDDFGSPIQVVMRPACLVRMVLALPRSRDGENPAIRADVSAAIPWPYSLNRVILDVVRCTTQEPTIEIALPPGEYELHGYAGDDTVWSGYKRFTVSGDARRLDLGTVELRAGR